MDTPGAVIAAAIILFFGLFFLSLDLRKSLRRIATALEALARGRRDIG